jgi:protein ImuA
LDRAGDQPEACPALNAEAAGPPRQETALDRPALLAALRARVARLDRTGGDPAYGPAARGTLGVPLCGPIDRALPGGAGLARAAIHEVLAAEPGAAAGFAALLLARAARPPGTTSPRGSLLWIAAEPDAWPPGLAQFGISPADLVLVQARRPRDGLWAMEESLRCPGVAGALLTVAELDMTAARRLQLAAEAGGALGLLLRPDTLEAAGATAALTRWRVEALAGAGGGAHDLGDPRWRLAMLRCRGGRPGAWNVVWRGAAERLELDMEPSGMEQAERQSVPATLPRAGRRRGGAAA